MAVRLDDFDCILASWHLLGPDSTASVEDLSEGIQQKSGAYAPLCAE
jgi:hypothetical protein